MGRRGQLTQAADRREVLLKGLFVSGSGRRCSTISWEKYA